MLPWKCHQGYEKLKKEVTSGLAKQHQLSKTKQHQEKIKSYPPPQKKIKLKKVTYDLCVYMLQTHGEQIRKWGADYVDFQHFQGG